MYVYIYCFALILARVRGCSWIWGSSLSANSLIHSFQTFALRLENPSCTLAIAHTHGATLFGCANFIESAVGPSSHARKLRYLHFASIVVVYSMS